ncbi:MAG: 50S ribosomal protein L5 [Bacteriovoracales bacterium]|nr:50S ribosomal protein L5 [Bacteriovoracales bacterium]
MARLMKMYKEKIVPQFKEDFKFKNIHQVPRLEKIVVNCVTRDCVQNGKVVDSIKNDLSVITGQKAVTARAKKSIASFKVREGMSLGAYVTLRGHMMYEFLDRLVNFTLPRVKDFRGISTKAFDGRGNYVLGIKEQIVFPEINYDKIDKIRGLGVSIVTTAKNNDEGKALLKAFGMPFREK